MRKLLFAMMAVWPLAGGAFELGFPLQCELGKDCFIQNYVDTDPSPAYADYQCGKMTYNGHDGTDIRVANFTVLERGVNVIAASPGTVLGVRDGVADTGLMNPDIANKECGNGVLVQHAEGWQTQYCHMKKGSIRVAKGQPVASGDVLGQVGFSGQTEFPHLHLSVRHNGKKLDPFTGSEMGTASCNAVVPKGIWAQALSYNPTHMMGMAFSTEAPDADGVRRGKFVQNEMLLDAPLLALWVDIIGIQADDRLVMSIATDKGDVLFQKEEIFAKPKAQQFFFIGRKRPDPAWLSGIYIGKAALMRGDKAVFSEERRLTAHP